MGHEESREDYVFAMFRKVLSLISILAFAFLGLTPLPLTADEGEKFRRTECLVFLKNGKMEFYCNGVARVFPSSEVSDGFADTEMIQEKARFRAEARFKLTDLTDTDKPPASLAKIFASFEAVIGRCTPKTCIGLDQFVPMDLFSSEAQIVKGKMTKIIPAIMGRFTDERDFFSVCYGGNGIGVFEMPASTKGSFGVEAFRLILNLNQFCKG
ncbi:hypothetical protein [Aliiroseovarius crassostreae]|uniref:hypothetical protein n=1 Tax=Aliiroseovarius crassostreae TaxID=154981 RepID=UPI00220DCA93|nr:hypothetical protein [Aliiroseovarius crassostreae]UWQ06112.1 hypothetical protein K3X22_06730 [Aliiroseovarius crassostreae]